MIIYHTATPLPDGKVLTAGGMQRAISAPPMMVGAPVVFHGLPQCVPAPGWLARCFHVRREVPLAGETSGKATGE